MKTAKLNNKVIAQSENTVEASSYIYFPVKDINMKFLSSNEHSSVCPFKGTASYYDVIVDGVKSENAAWYYSVPKKDFEYIKDYVAFWKDVEIS